MKIKNILKADLRMTICNKLWMWAGIIFFVLAMASFGTFESYLRWAYLFAPLAILPLASLSISTERDSGFINNIFTTPVTDRVYIISKFLLWVCVGIIYIVCTLPLTLVHLYFVDNTLLWMMVSHIFASVLIICFLSALGLFISLLCARETKIALSLGFILAAVFYIMFISFPGEIQGGDTIRSVLFHFSPLVLAGDFLESWWFSRTTVEYPLLPLYPVLSVLSLVLFSIFILFSSYFLFKKLQNVENFDFRNNIFLIFLISILIIVPPLLGNNEYAMGEERISKSYSSSGGSLGLEVKVSSQFYYDKPMEMKVGLDPGSGNKKLHNVLVTLSSEELGFVPSVIAYPEISMDSSNFNFSTVIDPLLIDGAVYSYYRYRIDLTSDEGSGHISGTIEIENLSARRAVRIAFLISAALFACISVITRRKTKMIYKKGH